MRHGKKKEECGNLIEMMGSTLGNWLKFHFRERRKTEPVSTPECRMAGKARGVRGG